MAPTSSFHGGVMMPSNGEAWHLSKSVPISLFATLLVQVGAFLWIIATMDSQISINKEHIDQLQLGLGRQETKSGIVAVQLGRIDENLKANRRTLEKIEALFND